MPSPRVGDAWPAPHSSAALGHSVSYRGRTIPLATPTTHGRRARVPAPASDIFGRRPVGPVFPLDRSDDLFPPPDARTPFGPEPLEPSPVSQDDEDLFQAIQDSINDSAARRAAETARAAPPAPPAPSTLEGPTTTVPPPSRNWDEIITDWATGSGPFATKTPPTSRPAQSFPLGRDDSAFPREPPAAEQTAMGETPTPPPAPALRMGAPIQPLAVPEKPSAISPTGLTALKTREGFRDTPYSDMGGLTTIGYGFTTWKGKPVTKDLRITAAEAEEELAAQLAEKEQRILGKLEVPVSQAQYDSLLSVAWNHEKTAKKIIDKLNTGEAPVLEDFTWSATVKGKPVAGLQNRRIEEYAPFMASPQQPPQMAPTAAKTLPSQDEAQFQQWYATHAQQRGLNPDPDAPGQFYDYRAAFKAGAKPDASGHWPSEFKKPGHENEVVGGFNTRTGEPVPGTTQLTNVDELVKLGWERPAALELVKKAAFTRLGIDELPVVSMVPELQRPPDFRSEVVGTLPTPTTARATAPAGADEEPPPAFQTPFGPFPILKPGKQLSEGQQQQLANFIFTAGQRLKPPDVEPTSASPWTRSVWQVLNDAAVTGGMGGAAVGDFLVSLADVVLDNSIVGHAIRLLPPEKRPASVGQYLETLGYSTKADREFLERLYSEPQKTVKKATAAAAKGYAQADQLRIEALTVGYINAGHTAADAIELAKADVDTKLSLYTHGKRAVDFAIANIKNPSNIAYGTLESIPLMAAGGVVARGLGAAGVGAKWAGALGEGISGALAQRESIRQSNPEGAALSQGQEAAALAAGVGTSLFSRFGAALADKLGVADVDTLMAAARKSPEVRKSVVSLMKAVPLAMLQEGVFEELPQGIQEQVFQNLAEGKPWHQGLAENAVMSMFAGAAMGGTVQFLQGGVGTAVDVRDKRAQTQYREAVLQDLFGSKAEPTLEKLIDLRQDLQVGRQSENTPENIAWVDQRIAAVDALIRENLLPGGQEGPLNFTPEPAVYPGEGGGPGEAPPPPVAPPPGPSPEPPPGEGGGGLGVAPAEEERRGDDVTDEEIAAALREELEPTQAPVEPGVGEPGVAPVEPIEPIAEAPAVEPVSPPPPAAGVPFVVTTDTRQQLHDLGYSRADVDAMTPQQALDLVQAGAVNPSAPISQPPRPRMVSRQRLNGWLGEVAPEHQEPVFAAMRAIDARAQAYHDEARKLTPPQGTIGAGMADKAAFQQGEARSTFLRALNSGSTPEQAGQLAKETARLIADRANATRPKDVHSHVPPGAVDAAIDDAVRAITRAVPAAAAPAAEPTGDDISDEAIAAALTEALTQEAEQEPGPRWRPGSPYEAEGSAPADVIAATIEEQLGRRVAIAQLADRLATLTPGSTRYEQANRELKALQETYDGTWAELEQHMDEVDVPGLTKQVEESAATALEEERVAREAAEKKKDKDKEKAKDKKPEKKVTKTVEPESPAPPTTAAERDAETDDVIKQREALKAEAAALVKEIKAKLNRISANAPLDPEITIALVKLARNYIQRGVLEFKLAARQLREDFGENKQADEYFELAWPVAQAIAKGATLKDALATARAMKDRPTVAGVLKEGEPKGKPGKRRHAAGGHGLQDSLEAALSPKAQAGLEAMFKGYTRAWDLRHIREAMEVYQRLLDEDTAAARTAATTLRDATEAFFLNETHETAQAVDEAAYEGLQLITGDDDPDPAALLENEVFATAREAGRLVFETLDPKTATFDIEEFNTAFGEVEWRRDGTNVFPAPTAALNLWKGRPYKRGDNWIGLGQRDGTPVIANEAGASQLEAWKAAATAAAKPENARKVVLSLFDRTGIIGAPWAAAGYSVRRFDIRPKADGGTAEDLTDFGEWMAEIENIISEGYTIVGVLAQPPCTSFTSSGSQHWPDKHDAPNREWLVKTYGKKAAEHFDTPTDYANTLVAVVKLIVAQANPRFYMMENPVGRIAELNGLPDATLKFHPDDFGEAYTKATQLWGEFNTELPQARVGGLKQEGGEGSRTWNLSSSDVDERAQTAEGFAYAFFMANQALAQEEWQNQERPAMEEPAPGQKYEPAHGWDPTEAEPAEAAESEKEAPVAPGSVIAFRSGNQSAINDLVGFISAGQDVGVTALGMTGPVRDAIVQHVAADGNAFIDSGAFGKTEIVNGKGVPTIDFKAVMSAYRKLAADVVKAGGYPTGLYVVAPDVAPAFVDKNDPNTIVPRKDGVPRSFPDETKAIQDKYADQITAAIDANMNVIVPV